VEDSDAVVSTHLYQGGRGGGGGDGESVVLGCGKFHGKLRAASVRLQESMCKGGKKVAIP